MRHKRLKPLLEIIYCQFLSCPMLQSSIYCFRWDKNIIDDLDYSIGSDAIFNGHRSKGVDLDADEASITAYINAERFALKKRGEINLYWISQRL